MQFLVDQINEFFSKEKVDVYKYDFSEKKWILSIQQTTICIDFLQKEIQFFNERILFSEKSVF